MRETRYIERLKGLLKERDRRIELYRGTVRRMSSFIGIRLKDREAGLKKRIDELESELGKLSLGIDALLSKWEMMEKAASAKKRKEAKYMNMFINDLKEL